MSGRRAYALALIVLLVAGAAVVVSASMPWATAGVPLVPGSGTSTEQAWTGSQIAPMSRAAGILAIAGVAGILATGMVGRLIVGLLLVLAGATGAWASAHVIADGTMGLPGGAGAADASLTGWPWGGLAGCMLVALVGAVTVRAGRSWPRLGGRFDGRRSATAASPWDALDAGEDPTA